LSPGSPSPPWTGEGKEKRGNRRRERKSRKKEESGGDEDDIFFNLTETACAYHFIQLRLKVV